MEGRNDALCAAAEMILAVNRLPEKMGGNMVATVGEIHNQPQLPQHHPGPRSTSPWTSAPWDDDLALRAWDVLAEEFDQIASARGCPLEKEITWRVEHSPFDPRLVQMVLDKAASLGYSTNPMVSGAGHDASYMNQVCPTAMIFVPSIGGRSHVEVEETPWEDCEAGVPTCCCSV